MENTPELPKEEGMEEESLAPPTCNKNDPKDPHYGENGWYDSNCQWHPEL